MVLWLYLKKIHILEYLHLQYLGVASKLSVEEGVGGVERK